MRWQYGFGLFEMLVALLLSGFIITMLMQLYLSSKAQYQEAQLMFSEAFDIEWISNLMRDSIRYAGFTPCRNIDALKVVDRRAWGKKHQALVIQGTDNPRLQIKRMNEQFGQVLQFQKPKHLLVSTYPPLSSHKPIMVADCYHAEIHTIEAVEHKTRAQKITLTKPLALQYKNTIYVGEWIEEEWHIQQKALYYQREKAEKVSSLIQNMKIVQHREAKKLWLKIGWGLKGGRLYEWITTVRSQ